MSLNYDLTSIKDHESVCFIGGNLNTVTEGIIFSSMTVGLGEITPKNVDEWMIRLTMADKLFGTILKLDGQQRSLTRQEIEAHIGLKTNVRNEKRPSWSKRMTEQFFREEEYKITRNQHESCTY